MILIQAVQKLLNSSKLKAPLYISAASPQQVLHCWYAKLVRTSFSGKMLVMFVHDPSGLTILVKGKTVQSTFLIFKERLLKFLLRNNFSQQFIETELSYMEEGFVVGKTTSKKMLGRMNQLTYIVEDRCIQSDCWEEIPIGRLEDLIASHIFLENKKYLDPLDYFKELGVLTGNPFSGLNG